MAPNTDAMTAAVESLADNLEAAADEYGNIDDDASPEITVEYETRQGNTRTRTGEVWSVTDGGTFEDRIVRFSADAGTDDEDSYALKITHGRVELVSYSDAGRETTLARDVSGIDHDDVAQPAVADGGVPQEGVARALRDVNTTAVAAAIRNSDPLAYHDEYQHADDAASEVTA